MSTKRPRNACRGCGYSWYPRGKDVSLTCPNCKSGNIHLPDVEAAEALAKAMLFGCGGLLLVLVPVGLVLGCIGSLLPNRPAAAPVAVNAPTLPNAGVEVDRTQRPVKAPVENPARPKAKQPVNVAPRIPSTPVEPEPTPFVRPPVQDDPAWREGGFGRRLAGLEPANYPRSGPVADFAPTVKPEPIPPVTLRGLAGYPVALAVDGTSLGYYRTARDRGDEKTIAQMVKAKTLFLITDSLAVEVEIRSPKTVFVRVLEGPLRGKLLAVDPYAVK